MPTKRKREHSTDVPSDAESSDSNPAEDNATLKAVKDRECPFCHQAFTSSSLGRHLDLYIRPNNPKRPDGVHKVDEILRIRGSITRRQPKGSGKSKDRETLKEPQDVRSDTGEEDQREAQRRLPKPSHLINELDWRATGVINEVRSTPSVGRSTEATNGRTPGPQLPPIDTRSPTVRSTSDTIEEQLETGKAAELALRQVLDSIAAARREHDGRALFDGVDLCTLSYPSLCLTLLPPPRTLHSTTPFADDESWDLVAPGARERPRIETAVSRHKISSRRIREHIAMAYDQWVQLSEQERTSRWTLEVLRAYSQAKACTDGLQTQLAIARQRIEHLETEYELLSRCQLPRERMLNPPTTVPITKPTLDSLAAESTAEGLIDKWRSTIRTVARPKKSTSTALARVNYADSAVRRQDSSTGKAPGTRDLSADMIMSGAVFGIEGPMSKIGQFDELHEIAARERNNTNGRVAIARMVDNR